MKQQVIVLGDIEMGGGTLTDDFISDRALSELILSLSQRPHPVDLVLNGDTFYFLKCPSQRGPPAIYPRHITKDISLAKLKLISAAHSSVFKALQEFSSLPGKEIYLLPGNHDEDLAYPEVKAEIKKLLGNSSRVHFPQIYKNKDVYVEHGQQYDFLFAMNYDKLFLKHKGAHILNIPFVTLGLISTFMRLKEEHPFLERIFPRPELLTHHRIVAKQVSRKTIGYFLKSLLYYPFRFYSDPTYSFPTNLFQELYRRLVTVHWDVDDITTIFQKKVPGQQYTIYVLGHLHEKRIEKSRNRVVIHPGSWRDEYDFQPKTRELIPRTKRYVEITLHPQGSSYTLIDYPLPRSIFYFDDVLKDELAFIRKAAKEEGFSPQL